MIRHKFSNVPTEIGGARFQSKKEARYWSDLLLARRSADLLFALRQVPFHLPGVPREIIYRVDFAEFWKDGSVRFVDVKGFRTRGYINKAKQVEALYGVKIIEA